VAEKGVLPLNGIDPMQRRNVARRSRWIPYLDVKAVTSLDSDMSPPI
jgi:hypothetical protein